MKGLRLDESITNTAQTGVFQRALDALRPRYLKTPADCKSTCLVRKLMCPNFSSIKLDQRLHSVILEIDLKPEQDNP